MTPSDKNNKLSVDQLLLQLQERAKELNCIYKVDEALSKPDTDFDQICQDIIKAIPPGWQYPDFCVAKLELNDATYTSPGFIETEWAQTADIIMAGVIMGKISVFYTREMPNWDEGPFLKEETKLIKSIADKIGQRLSHLKMRAIIEQWEGRQQNTGSNSRGDWQVVLQMLKQTDRNLYLSISRKMLHYMCWSGVKEADNLLQTFTPDPHDLEETVMEGNQPYARRQSGFSPELCGAVFKIASENMADNEIIRLIQKWIQEDKLSFLVQVVNRNLSLGEVADAIRRYQHLAEHEPEIHSPNKKGIEVSLIRRFLSDQLDYVNIAKNFIEVKDFYHLLNRVIFSTESHGRLGGKSAGLYLASQIVKKNVNKNELLSKVKIPRTYYITSDVLLYFMHYNNFDEVVEQKYKPINQVRFEYPHIVQTFKNARFPADIVNGLSAALDEFGDHPLIVRSSSLLEDRIGAVFSGKYKSLFVANQGNKQQRLEALLDAIAEVYASTFSPDPIEYRIERKLIDFGEEMGIMIQEVVGNKVGNYFLPSYAGVAFSRNEFRWSPRINREDGLIRLVPGLGTRAVDRLSDDYPLLIAPGQPGLRVNTRPEEIEKYSPKKIDIINLETNSFETIDLHKFLQKAGSEMPGIRDMVSVYNDDFIRIPSGLIDYDNENVIVTFNNLTQNTPFVGQTKAILDTLEETLGLPVDIEFASDGRNFYLLQCRPQSYSTLRAPSPIPKGTPRERIIFTAKKYISNGRLPEITHIVYINSSEYSSLKDKSTMMDVGRAVGKLNQLLPKRKFILMGPGRWGSRGDIKLGVSVTYSDINNTAALIEIARRKGNYIPDLSFGTHFFQDLVEADIRYLPLYPDEADTIFNEKFLTKSKNIFPEIVPQFSYLSNTIMLIDVPRETNGKILKILLNADLGEGIGLLAEPSQDTNKQIEEEVIEPVTRDSFWQWRLRMAEYIAESLDAKKYGVVNFYIFGSTKNASAGPASDIDLLIHFRGTEDQKNQLLEWLEGWSLCLSEMNFLQTGYRTDGLLDVHIVNDADIKIRTSWAAKIGAVTDAAKPLKMKSPPGN